MTMNYSLITHVETQKQRFLEGSSEDVSGSFNGRGGEKKSLGGYTPFREILAWFMGLINIIIH